MSQTLKGSRFIVVTGDTELCVHGGSKRLCSQVFDRRVALVGGGQVPLWDEGSGLDHFDLIVRVNHLPESPCHGGGSVRTDVFVASLSREFFEAGGLELLGRMEGGLVVFPRLLFDTVPIHEHGKHTFDFLKFVSEVNPRSTIITFPQRVVRDNYLKLGGYPTTGSLAVLSFLQHEPREMFITGFSFYERHSSRPLKGNSTALPRASSSAFVGHDVCKELIMVRRILGQTSTRVGGDETFTRIVYGSNYQNPSCWRARVARLRFKLKLLASNKLTEDPHG